MDQTGPTFGHNYIFQGGGGGRAACSRCYSSYPAISTYSFRGKLVSHRWPPVFALCASKALGLYSRFKCSCHIKSRLLIFYMLACYNKKVQSNFCFCWGASGAFLRPLLWLKDGHPSAMRRAHSFSVYSTL